MKRYILPTLFLIAIGGSAMAQNNEAPVTAPGETNMTAPNSKIPPVAGANSFTEAQAKARIENAGYSAVSGLTKDDSGVWRGKASKNGTMSGISLDYQGNVTAR